MSADEGPVGAGSEAVSPSQHEVEPNVRPEAHLDEWVAPDIGDERGYLRAGKVFEWMDVVGVLAATRHCRRPVATASVDGRPTVRPKRARAELWLDT